MGRPFRPFRKLPFVSEADAITAVPRLSERVKGFWECVPLYRRVFLSLLPAGSNIERKTRLLHTHTSLNLSPFHSYPTNQLTCNTLPWVKGPGERFAGTKGTFRSRAGRRSRWVC